MKRNQSRRNLAYPAAYFLLFAGFAAAVALGVSDSLDAAIRVGINGQASPWLTDVFMAVTRLGDLTTVAVLTLLATTVLLFLGRRLDALRLDCTMVVAVLLNHAVKLAFARPRPPAYFGDVPPNFSFASGHALYAACFYGAVGLLIAAALPRPWQRALVLAATLMIIGTVGLSRIYLGVHYPTDVFAGFALAGALLSAAYALFPDGRSRT